MPRQKVPVKPRHSRPDLVRILADEMKKQGVSSTPETPTVYEEDQPYGGGIHVKVIWNTWREVPLEERGAIILDAYEQAGLTQEIPKIRLALGLTPEEERRIHPN